MAIISFIPSQMGQLADYYTRATRDGPLWLLIKDIGVLATVLPYLPLVFFPIKKHGGNQDGHSRLASFRDNVIQALLFLVEIISLILFIPALIVLPGLLFIVFLGLCVLIAQLIAWPTQGPRIVESTVSEASSHHLQQQPQERWVFINGICTGRTGLQENVNRISLLFGRKVQGIHNQSYGMIGDLLECLFQRCLSYRTMDVRVAIEVIKEHLLNPEVKKVVLLAHSQGGIIASMVVDHLLMEISPEGMGKLEIYTFGSAASHFRSPPTTKHSALLPNQKTDSVDSHPSCIRHIEHYANEYDMIPRWGVLYATKNLLNNRYAGKVFIRMGATGHMFVDHYLDPIFALPGRTDGVQGSPQGRSKVKNALVTARHVEDTEIEEADSYLSTVVDVDSETEERRSQRKLKSLVKVKNIGQVHAVPVPMLNGVNGHVGDGIANGVIGEPDSELAAILEGTRDKTVRELSRLWKYLGGGSVED